MRASRKGKTCPPRKFWPARFWKISNRQSSCSKKSPSDWSSSHSRSRPSEVNYPLDQPVTPITETDFGAKITAARETLDAWTRQMVEWHFSPETGCPFWLDYASKLGWDPRREIRSYDDLDRLGPFQDEWLRGGPVT